MVMYDSKDGKGCLGGTEVQLAYEIATVIVMYVSRVLGYNLLDDPIDSICKGYENIDKAIAIILKDKNLLEKSLGTAYEVQQMDKLVEVLRKIRES